LDLSIFTAIWNSGLILQPLGVCCPFPGCKFSTKHGGKVGLNIISYHMREEHDLEYDQDKLLLSSNVTKKNLIIGEALMVEKITNQSIRIIFSYALSRTAIFTLNYHKVHQTILNQYT
jgi:hypothetical protein